MKTKRHISRATAGLLALALVVTSLLSLSGVVSAKDGSRVEVETETQQSTTSGGSTGTSGGHTETEIETENETEVQHATEVQRQEIRQRAEQAKEAAKAKVAEAKDRLEGAKLKACEAREKGITTAMSQLTQRSQNNLDVITKISDRVQAFYKEKGRTAANYDALVAEVNAKKQLAEAAVASTSSVSQVFSCDSDSPKTASNQFKSAHAAAVAALKDYRTAVKNLIVAVKAAQSESSSNSTTQSQTESSTNE